MRNTSTARKPVSKTAHTANATIIGRSPRKGSLARLMGILTLLPSPFQVSQQSGVLRAKAAEGALQGLGTQRKSGERVGSKAAQQQTADGRGQLVFDVRKRGLQNGQHFGGR